MSLFKSEKLNNQKLHTNTHSQRKSPMPLEISPFRKALDLIWIILITANLPHTVPPIQKDVMGSPWNPSTEIPQCLQ